MKNSKAGCMCLRVFAHGHSLYFYNAHQPMVSVYMVAPPYLISPWFTTLQKQLHRMFQINYVCILENFHDVTWWLPRALEGRSWVYSRPDTSFRLQPWAGREATGASCVTSPEGFQLTSDTWIDIAYLTGQPLHQPPSVQRSIKPQHGSWPALFTSSLIPPRCMKWAQEQIFQ